MTFKPYKLTSNKILNCLKWIPCQLNRQSRIYSIYNFVPLRNFHLWWCSHHSLSQCCLMRVFHTWCQRLRISIQSLTKERHYNTLLWLLINFYRNCKKTLRDNHNLWSKLLFWKNLNNPTSIPVIGLMKNTKYIWLLSLNMRTKCVLV